MFEVPTYKYFTICGYLSIIVKHPKQLKCFWCSDLTYWIIEHHKNKIERYSVCSQLCFNVFILERL